MRGTELIEDTATGGVADFLGTPEVVPIERRPGDEEIALQTLIVR